VLEPSDLDRFTSLSYINSGGVTQLVSARKALSRLSEGADHVNLSPTYEVSIYFA